MTVIDPASEIPPIDRRTDASEVALAAYQQLFELLGDLAPEDWAAATECAGWRVRDMVGHLLGAARANASMRENLRQQLWGVRHRRQFGGNPLDAVNALQISDHAQLDTGQLLGALRDAAPGAVKGRMRTPAAMRVLTVPLAAGGSSASGMPRSVNLGHLADVVYTRDIWMQTVDIARAVQRAPDVTQPVNRRIVGDVVAEWTRRHGQPVDLILTGPAGGHYRSADANRGTPSEHDAIDFCRALSGRETGEGLMASRVIF
ncbi:MAG: maleylpyruvate isomerase family mycothiol-dependent enzyme [Pseudonocardiales bacterium]|nr:maleylpyruvate isomerase family mycothiol-dependent enzyme [Pseudonocardiales bacterium]